MKMIQSKFNVFFPHENHQVGFNSFSNEYILLEPMLHEMYEASAKSRDFTELEQVH